MEGIWFSDMMDVYHYLESYTKLKQELKNMKKRVGIIGGGASGLVAAIGAARNGAEVTVIEHMDRVGKKILSTGNGRCNLTNYKMEEDCYRCGRKDFPMQVIRGFDVKETLDLFMGLGIVPKTETVMFILIPTRLLLF